MKYALFVHRGDGRYRWADRIGREYVRESAAQKAADAMNARGEHGGNVVVRSFVFMSPEPNPPRRRSRRQHITAKRRRANGKRNPPASHTRGYRLNSNDTVAFRLVRIGGFVEQIKYEDYDDKKHYVHDAEDVNTIMYLAEHHSFGKCLIIANVDGKPLWRNA